MYQLIANRLLQTLAGCFRHPVARPVFVLPLLCWLYAAPLHAVQQQGTLYQFQKPGGEIHYLFGTMHSADPRVIRILEQIAEPLASSQQLVMEMVPDVAAIMSSSSSMLLPSGQTLPQVLGGELYESVLAAAADKGLADSALQRFKPWAVAVTISLPEPQGLFLDQRLYQLALQNGQAVYGLESVAEQMAVFDSLPQSLQIRMLQDALDQLHELPAMLETMITTYLAGDLAKLRQLTLAYELSSKDKELADWFRVELIVKRNVRMAERLQDLLDKGSTFVAVGALHLVDESGLIRTLKQAGYRVEAVE